MLNQLGRLTRVCFVFDGSTDKVPTIIQDFHRMRATCPSSSRRQHPRP
jgi:hypothetical protein